MQIKDIRITHMEAYELLGIGIPEQLYAYLGENGDLTLNGYVTATKQCKVPAYVRLEASLHQAEDGGIISRATSYTTLDNLNKLGYMTFGLCFYSVRRYIKNIQEGSVYITLYPTFEK